MTEAEFAALLDEAVSATRVERYRHLCSEANTLPSPNSRDDWRRWIAERRWVPTGQSPIDPGYAAQLPPLGGCCP